MPPTRPILSLGLAVLLAAGIGCTTTVAEPEAAFSDLPTQTYPFDTVWHCCLEAVRAEEFEIEGSEREGNSGEFATQHKVIKKNALTRIHESRRLRVRVEEAGEEAYRVRVAASIFQREGADGEWSYQGHDPALVEAVETELARSLKDHYQGGSR